MQIPNVRDQIDRIRADRFLMAWNLSIFLVLALPLLFFTIARTTNSGDEAAEYQYDMYGNRIHWWQFWKKQGYGNQQNDGNDGQEENEQDNGAPWWYLWKDDRNGEDEGNGTLVFVYLWSFASLIALGIFGNMMVNRGNYEALRMTLFAFANYTFIVMIMVGGLDAIQTEGREIESTGWYGQTSVLLFLTCLFGFFKSLVFPFWLTKKSAAANEDDRQIELIDGSDNARV